ncbi:uncharacterized protein MYCGRDRAFT_97567 [Zymoseptoria tritici IPO323]|uniref:Actin-like ATPase domain-containing protein n=1 Tax=Zymoseptoria tritici (strain CBS 115943 / IPO323) TaxID=336722 RepID=F9XQM6_ZYMTI|nr:uncharacterized protein MYCGRDRAFT_97567 [Zymoseptoria tritici IPO323]EGP82386.1 hypothetical protein MYCGRDRAFT_97567 [Zymoseptoria tritici IPO323]
MEGTISSSLHKLIIGVDFGTTATGISWVSTAGAHVKVLDDVHCIMNWPGGNNSCKTPSRLAYANNNESINANAFGFEVKSYMESFAWMKLLLDPEQATKFDDPSLTKSEGDGVLKRPINKTPVELCADYLTEVIQHAYAYLSRTITAEVLEATPIDFWFTVPAVWSDKAKADTLRAARYAAKQAKLRWHPDSQLFLIREPEAAAVATVSALTQGGSQQHIKVGDSILICDCGGGTVDITTYVIDSITPKLAFKELLVGTGGKCGSTYIDRQFLEWMEDMFGPHFTSLPPAKRGPASALMKSFETAKLDFGMSTDIKKYYEVDCFMEEAHKSHWYDDSECGDLKSMFDPVVDKIIALLQSQLDAERRQAGQTVFLVGGFGESAYLNAVLHKCQSAIVRGAALSGLHNIQPTSRRSRLHYGWSCSEAFDPMRHDERDAYLDPWYNNGKRATGNMCWELSKGDLVDETTKVDFGFAEPVYEDFVKSGSFNLDLYCVHKLASISLNYGIVDLTCFESKVANGRRMRRICAEVAVHFGHRRGVLVFTAVVNGKEIGATEVNFNGQSTTDVTESMSNMDIGSNAGALTPSCAQQ